MVEQSQSLSDVSVEYPTVEEAVKPANRRTLLWRLLIPVPQAEIGSPGNEKSGSFFRTSLSRMVQWCKTRQICRIDISPGIKQG